MSHISKCSEESEVYHTGGINCEMLRRFEKFKMASKMAAIKWCPPEKYISVYHFFHKQGNETFVHAYNYYHSVL